MRQPVPARVLAVAALALCCVAPGAPAPNQPLAAVALPPLDPPAPRLAPVPDAVPAGSAGVAAANHCEGYLIGMRVAWMAVYHGQAGVGTAVYFPNGTLVTYGPDGSTIVNIGNYTITEGKDGTCYEQEYYSYPPEAAPTCNTFTGDSERGYFVGCEVFGTHCFESCETEKEWENWYAARLIGKIADLEEEEGEAAMVAE